jgi:hypothetical protein
MRTYASLAYGLARFASERKAFLRSPISLDQARAIVGQGMQARDVALLTLIERGIFANPTSPYLRLFRAAGCELGDVRRLLTQEGVEGALRKLFQAGIYVTFEEFKGLAPAVRGSQTFAFHATDFDNPLTTPHVVSSTGGTRRSPTRILIDLDHLAQMAPHWALWFAVHGVLTSPLVFVNPYFPGAVGHQLLCAKFGNRFVKWFATGAGGTVTYRLVSAYVHGLTRKAGGFPRPDFISLDAVATVGEFLAGMVADGMRPCVNTAPSTAARICLAMQGRGVSLANVTFLLGAEPLTPTRRQVIESAGARATVTYGFSEGGNVGSQCQNPAAADDIHISLDAYAAIQHTRMLSDGDAVDALLLTALRPASPKILLNAEIGDHAVLETRRCWCLFDNVGYRQHLHTIRSFEKLTGEGVTFVGADLFHLLEHVLPGLYGGSLADYQLVEEQDGHGLPRYTLLVSPDLGRLDEQKLVVDFLNNLAKAKRPYRFMASQWAQTGALRVQRGRPVVTARGKQLPFRTLRADASASAEENAR